MWCESFWNSGMMARTPLLSLTRPAIGWPWATVWQPTQLRPWIEWGSPVPPTPVLLVWQPMQVKPAFRVVLCGIGLWQPVQKITPWASVPLLV